MGEQADYILGDLVYRYGWFCRTRLKCKYCGSRKVFWKQLPTGRWRMHDTVTQRPHECEQYKKPVKPASIRRMHPDDEAEYCIPFSLLGGDA